MKNNGTMYQRLLDNEIYYPEEVFPFEYEKIELFACEDKGKWVVTEKKVGYAIAYGESLEDVSSIAIARINVITAKKVKKLIREAVKNTKEGLFYDYEIKEWKKPSEFVTAC
jgi:hypothetical protein